MDGGNWKGCVCVLISEWGKHILNAEAENSNPAHDNDYKSRFVNGKFDRSNLCQLDFIH